MKPLFYSGLMRKSGFYCFQSFLDFLKINFGFWVGIGGFVMLILIVERDFVICDWLLITPLLGCKDYCFIFDTFIETSVSRSGWLYSFKETYVSSRFFLSLSIVLIMGSSRSCGYSIFRVFCFVRLDSWLLTF